MIILENANVMLLEMKVVGAKKNGGRLAEEGEFTKFPQKTTKPTLFLKETPFKR